MDDSLRPTAAVYGENEEVAHGANRTMTTNARKTAPHRRIPSYCEFATHRRISSPSLYRTLLKCDATLAYRVTRACQHSHCRLPASLKPDKILTWYYSGE